MEPGVLASRQRLYATWPCGGHDGLQAANKSGHRVRNRAEGIAAAHSERETRTALVRICDTTSCSTDVIDFSPWPIALGGTAYPSPELNHHPIPSFAARPNLDKVDPGPTLLASRIFSIPGNDMLARRPNAEFGSPDHSTAYIDDAEFDGRWLQESESHSRCSTGWIW